MKKFLALLTILGFLTGSCKNVYEEMASKDSEDAILYSARLALATGDWTLALSEFARLPAATLAQPEVVVDRASAYSGRCGLDFLELAEELESLNLSDNTTSLLRIMMANYPASSAANFADCKLAEDLLKTIATNGVVPNERGQYLMAFNSLAKIGTILSHRADSNDDGTINVGWDPCGGTGATDLPQNDVSEIGTGIVLLYRNLQGTEIGSAITDVLDPICTAAGTLCTITDISGITNAHRLVIRGIIRETTSNIGLKIGAGDAVANACQP